MADLTTGTGATLTMVDSDAVGVSFSGNVRSITGHTEEVDDIELGGLGITGHKEYIPGVLTEPGEFEAEFEHAPVAAMRGVGTTGTFTVTYGTGGTTTTCYIVSGTGYIKSVKQPDLTQGDVQTTTIGVKWDGKTGPTMTAAVTP